jgi:hypothetical protein
VVAPAMMVVSSSGASVPGGVASARSVGGAAVGAGLRRVWRARGLSGRAVSSVIFGSGRSGVWGSGVVSSLSELAPGLSDGLAGGRGSRSGAVRSGSVAPGSSVPGSGTGPLGAGGGSAAGGGSGFFFFGVAALLSLAALFVPRVLRTLRMFGASRAPSAFSLLLERPG